MSAIASWETQTANDGIEEQRRCAMSIIRNWTNSDEYQEALAIERLAQILGSYRIKGNWDDPKHLIERLRREFPRMSEATVGVLQRRYTELYRAR